jgi:hypothetical protein
VRVPRRASRINLERSPGGGVRQMPRAFPPGSDAPFESPNGTLGRPEARPAPELARAVRRAGRRGLEQSGQAHWNWFSRTPREPGGNDSAAARPPSRADRDEMVLQARSRTPEERTPGSLDLPLTRPVPRWFSKGPGEPCSLGECRPPPAATSSRSPRIRHVPVAVICSA